MKINCSILLVSILCLIITVPIYGASSRLALVVGNANYQHNPLEKTLNDAQDMARILQSFGFDVMLHTDTDKRSLKEAIRTFGSQLRNTGGVGLFYYSGHGVQHNEQNFSTCAIRSIDV